ncbi:MAG: energy-coupling factor transporter transmembrane component T [Synergistaceae bacterium]
MNSIRDAMRTFGRLEDLSEESSFLSGLHPSVKILSTLLYIITVVSFHRYKVSALVPMLFYPVILISLSGTPYGMILKRVAAALPFALAAGVANLFFDRETALHIAGFSVSFGFISFLSLMIKTTLSVMAVTVLAASTSMSAINGSLVSMHVPSAVCMQLALTQRYISVLADETVNRSRAYSLRSASKNGVRFQDMGFFVGQLLLRSFDKAGNIFCSMKCRGFDGTYRADRPRSLRTSDYVFFVISALAIILPRFVNISVMLGNLLG